MVVRICKKPPAPTKQATVTLVKFDIIHTVVLIQYIYLLEISVKHNNYCRSYSLNIGPMFKE